MGIDEENGKNAGKDTAAPESTPPSGGDGDSRKDPHAERFQAGVSVAGEKIKAMFRS